MDPIYRPENVAPAFQLNWGLTLFWRATRIPDSAWLAELQKTTEPDGVRVIKHRTLADNESQFFLSTKPHVPPSEILRSVKGRLQYAIRDRDPKAFQRNYCLRSIGAATRSVVEAYVADQLGHHRMADPRVQEQLAAFQRTYPEVDLSKPSFTSHGKYWYNLHVAIVNVERWMEVRHSVLSRLCDMIERAAARHGDRLSCLAVLPDHIHLTMGCEIGRSPEAVALSYLNNCAYSCGMRPMFQYGYYVGTFGEYDRGAV